MIVDSDRPSPLDQGYRIDRYELLYALAQGGMGTIWVARLQGKHGFEKLFAIKTILPKYADDPHFRRMFLDEARVASAIVHPNVGQILDLGEHQGILYLVMEWVDGDSLDRLMRNVEKAGEKLPLGFMLRVVSDTCLGLHAAHELTDRDGKSFDVVHRDISPQNVLVALNGCPKLIDFGVAKARDRMIGETSGVVVKGKIRYIPPQQALGLPIDRRADIWSMGALLYMGIAGETPYRGDNDLEVLRQIISGSPPDPLPSTVPEPISRVIGGCLQHAPSARYQTALELRTAIEQAMTEASAPYSVADVATYMREHTGHRVASRKQALDAALGALAVADDPMIPIDVDSTTARNGRNPRPIGTLAIAIGAASVVAAVVIIAAVRSHGQPKAPPASVSLAESASVPVLSRRPAETILPTVAVAVTSATVPAPRKRAPHAKARDDVPPANSGLGSAIDSRK